jgi:hypothetical protein
MARPKKDLSYLETIPIIKDFLKDNNILTDTRTRRYLLSLAKIYPYIIKQYGNFDFFIELDSNKKAHFFIEYINSEVNKKSKNHPEINYNKIKNNVLHTIWMVQGFLGYLGKHLRANPKWIEDFTPIPSFTSKINISDIIDLHKILPYKGRTQLEIQTLTGWNNIDLTKLRLDDFTSIKRNTVQIDIDSDDFLYIAKTREKTWKKNVIYLNLFDRQFYDEIERYCRINSIKSSEIIFSVKPPAISELYRYYLKKYTHLNQFTLPRYIRQFCFTQLQDIFKNDPDLFNVWTQHKMGVLRTHYIKNYIERLIPLYPKIKENLVLGNIKTLKIEVSQLKQNIKNEITLQNEKIRNLEEKQKEIEENKIDNIAEKIIAAIYKKDKI